MTQMKTAEMTLEKVDIIRKRFPISYREAYDSLERNRGNVVRALMELEDRKSSPGMIEQIEERITVSGQELAAKVQEIIRTGQTSCIRIMRDGRTIYTLPTAVGAVGALLFPTVTLFATVAAVSARYEIVLDKRPQGTELTGQPGIINPHHEVIEVHYCERPCE